jgi:hypothetical protein
MRNPVWGKRLVIASNVDIYLMKAQSDVQFLVDSDCRVHRFMLGIVRECQSCKSSILRPECRKWPLALSSLAPT